MKGTSILLTTVLAFLLLWVICSISSHNAGVLPEAVQYRSMTPTIAFDDILQRNLGDVIINAQAVSPGLISNPINGGTAHVKIVTTDENYPLMHPAKMAAGSFWGNTAKTTSFAAVLNEDLAVKLFKSTGIIGQEVIINGSKLTITGVRKEDKSFLSQISSDGTDTVYIPYSANVQDTFKTAQDIYMQQNVDGVTCAPEFSRYSIINQALNGALSEYSKTDYFAQSRILSQMRSIGFFISGMAAIILFIKIAVRMFGDMLCHFREKKDTFGQIDVRKQIKLSVIAGAALAAGVVVFWLVSFELFVPGHVIPPDSNVLDLGFYYHVIIKNLQVRNANPPDYYGNTAFYAFWVLGLLTAVFAGMAVILVRRIAKILLFK